MNNTNLHSVTNTGIIPVIWLELYQPNSHGGTLEVSSKLMLKTWTKLPGSMLFPVNHLFAL